VPMSPLWTAEDDDLLTRTVFSAACSDSDLDSGRIPGDVGHFPVVPEYPRPVRQVRMRP